MIDIDLKAFIGHPSLVDLEERAACDMFSGWKGGAIIGGLVSRALVHVDIKGGAAEGVERFKWGKRVRKVEQGAGGFCTWSKTVPNGRFSRLAPRR